MCSVEEVSENEYSDTDKEDVAITPYPSTLVLDGGSLQDLSGFSGDEQELLAAVASMYVCVKIPGERVE